MITLDHDGHEVARDDDLDPWLAARVQETAGIEDVIREAAKRRAPRSGSYWGRLHADIQNAGADLLREKLRQAEFRGRGPR